MQAAGVPRFEFRDKELGKLGGDGSEPLTHPVRQLRELLIDDRGALGGTGGDLRSVDGEHTDRHPDSGSVAVVHVFQ
jgi:hypothetical protein